jgi:hypothetical protein
MTDKASEINEYFEFSKVKRPSLINTVIFIVVVAGTTIAGLYAESTYGDVVVIVPFLSVMLWCDYSEITFRNTPHLKTLQTVVSCLYLLSGLVILAYTRETGWVYDHVVMHFL